MNSPFEEYRSLAENLREIIEQTRLKSDFHKSIFPELSSLSKSLETSIFSEFSRSFKSPIASEILEKSKLSLQKQLFDTSKLADISSSKVLPSVSSKIIKELQISQTNRQKELNYIYDFNQEISTWHKLIESNQKLFNPLQSEITTALTAWDSSLTKITCQFQKISLFQNKPILAERLLESSKVYTDFVSRTIESLDLKTNTKNIKALQASLHLAETQLLSSTDILSDIAILSEDDELVSSPRLLLLPDIQQKELITLVETGDEDEQCLISLSSTAKLSDDVRFVLQSITKCNEIVKVSGQSEIFKPTNKVLEVYADLPWLIAIDKKTFADVVDCLYFVFYEGAGKDKLRFLTSHGGVLDDRDCNFIWCIKHLRNKWLRHDPDHGKQADINKSRKELLAKLRWLGLNHVPISEKHFCSLHHRLIEETKNFLNKILERLISHE